MSYDKKFLIGIKNSTALFLMGLILCTSFFAPSVTSAAPRILNHQGRLLDSSGSLLGGSGTNYCLRFSFYEDPTPGAPDSRLWPTATPEKMTVLVKNGIFTAGIGDTDAGGDTLDFDFNSTDEVYLNIEVAESSGGSCAGVTSFENLSPRQRITSAANALNSNTVAGFTPAQSATDDQIPVLTGGNLLLGSTTAGIGSTGTNTFTFQPTATGDVQFFSGANKITSAGDLTIAGMLSAAGIVLPAGSIANSVLQNSSITLDIGTSGTDVAWDSIEAVLGGTATLNIPTASATARGVLSTSDWNVFNSKESAITASTTLKYYRGDKTWQTLNTTAVPEGSNLYWTNTRFDTRAAAISSLPSLATVGTITSGTWAGTIIDDAYISNSITASNYIPLTQKGSANGVAALDGNGKIPISQISSFAISDTFIIGSQAAMLALSAGIGDVAIRTDENKTYILATNDPTNIANWIEMLAPLDQVFSVNGFTGAVNISTTNVPEGSNLYFTDSRADDRILLQKGQPNGLATLDSAGKIPTSQLGSLSIANTFVVTDTADLTVLSATQGDFAVVTSDGKTYILADTDPTDLGNWIEILSSASVSSVNGLVGAVTLTTSNIAEGANMYYTDERSRTALSASGPLAYDSLTGLFTIDQSSSSTNGYLSATDWNIFNDKQAALAFGNITSSTTGITVGGGTGAIIGSGATIDIATASTSTTGLVTATDWNIFNNKQDALTRGNFTETGSSILSITGGSNAIIGSGLTVQVAQADATNAGFLSATDWSTFNAKEDALGYTPLNPVNNLSDVANTTTALNTLLPVQTGNSGKYLTTNGTDTSWATVAASTRLDQILAATATNTINNASYAQLWQWNSLTTQTGLGLSSSSNTSGALLSLSSTSTAMTTNTGLLNVSYSGTPSTSSQTTYAIYANNNVVGNTSQTRYGVRGGVSGGTLFAGGGTGVGGLFSSSVTGTSGYGVQGTVSGQLASGAYGVYGSSTATSVAGAYGVYGISTGGGLGYGTYGSASGTSGTSYGSYGIATTTLNGGTSFGGRFRAVANTSGATSVSYGVYGEAVTTGPGGTAYGGYFSATEVSANNIAGYFTATGGTNNYAGIFANGNVGIGDTTPDYKVDIESLSVDTDIFALSDSDGVCLHNPEAGSEVVTCSSDERLKTNITESSSVLSYFNSFSVKEYDVIASGDHMTGVIAQEVLVTHPELVSLGENGFYSVQLPNQWKIVKAIQELDIKISDIENFATAQNKTFLNNLIAWLADAANGITRVHVEQELCIGATCINEAELEQFKTWQGGQGGSGQSPVPDPDPIPEVTPVPDTEPNPEPSPVSEPSIPSAESIISDPVVEPDQQPEPVLVSPSDPVITS